MQFPRLTIPNRLVVDVPEDFRTRTVRQGREKITIDLPAQVRQPMVLNHGVGTDSTAMLVLLVEMFKAGDKDARPDRVIFADIGSEKKNTKSYIPVLREYLMRSGFPPLVIVAKRDRGLIDATLADSCERLKTMPSLAFGGKSCSIKWKTVEMDYSHARWLPAQQAWAVGMPILKLIGYDASPADMRRSNNPGDEQFSFAYPLRTAGLVRSQLQEIIAAAGLPDPGKSACFMCPATKKHEFPYLMENEPSSLARALRMEAAAMLQSARKGKKMTTKGLGRRWSWREHLLEALPKQMEKLVEFHDIGTRDWDAYQEIINNKPEVQANAKQLDEVTQETCDTVT